MGYYIELSIPSHKYSKELKNKIVNYAHKNNYERYFENIEISGQRNIIYKNIYILTFIFPDDIKYIIHFIKYIKSIKNSTINTIAYDNCIFRVIYSKKKNAVVPKNLNSDESKIIKILIP